MDALLASSEQLGCFVLRKGTIEDYYANTDISQFSSKPDAHAARPAVYRSLQKCAHAVRMMPQATELDRHNRAVFALAMMKGARANALVSPRLCHGNLIDELIFQDGREVRAKTAKTFETWFMPVDRMHCTASEERMIHLLKKRLYSPGDTVFPVQLAAETGGAFGAAGLSREPNANAKPVQTRLRELLRAALHPSQDFGHVW